MSFVSHGNWERSTRRSIVPKNQLAGSRALKTFVKVVHIIYWEMERLLSKLNCKSHSLTLKAPSAKGESGLADTFVFLQKLFLQHSLKGVSAHFLGG